MHLQERVFDQLSDNSIENPHKTFRIQLTSSNQTNKTLLPAYQRLAMCPNIVNDLYQQLHGEIRLGDCKVQTLKPSFDKVEDHFFVQVGKDVELLDIIGVVSDIDFEEFSSKCIIGCTLLLECRYILPYQQLSVISLFILCQGMFKNCMWPTFFVQ